MRSLYAQRKKKTPIKWKSDIDRSVFEENFESTNFQKCDNLDPSWNFYWIRIKNIHQFFQKRKHLRLSKHQLINHYQNYLQLTRKDLMVKNIYSFLNSQSQKFYINPQN